MKDDRFSNFPQPTNNFSDTREVRDMPEVRDTPRSMQPKDQFSNQGYFDTFDSRQPGWQSAINHLQNYTDNQRGLALQEYHRRTYGVPEFNHGHRAATYAHQPFPAPLASTTRPPFGEAQQGSRHGAFPGTQVAQTRHTETPRCVNATPYAFYNFEKGENWAIRSGNRIYSRRDQESLIEGHRSSNQYHRRLERGSLRLEAGINGGQYDADQSPFAQLLGSNLAHFVKKPSPS
jgi:hypothetical protein